MIEIDGKIFYKWKKPYIQNVSLHKCTINTEEDPYFRSMSRSRRLHRTVSMIEIYGNGKTRFVVKRFYLKMAGTTHQIF